MRSSLLSPTPRGFFTFFFDSVLLSTRVLRRRFSHAPDHTRIGHGGNGFVDAFHLDLMEPVIAEVKPVAKRPVQLQLQVVQRSGARVALAFPVLPVWNSVIGTVRVERPAAELEFVQMFVPAIVGPEDGFLELLERLVAADLDDAADLLVSKLLSHGPTR